MKRSDQELRIAYPAFHFFISLAGSVIIGLFTTIAAAAKEE